ALKNLQEVISATDAMVSGSAGTETSRPWTVTVPLAVPKAIVEIGTPTSAASWAAPSTGTPTVGTPSERRTMADPPWVVAAAPAVAASSREGDTSVASIEADTSMTIMIVAASFGTRTWWTGSAMATTSAASARATAAAGTWRRQPGRAGATSARTARLV